MAATAHGSYSQGCDMAGAAGKEGEILDHTQPTKCLASLRMVVSDGFGMVWFGVVSLMVWDALGLMGLGKS